MANLGSQHGVPFRCLLVLLAVFAAPSLPSCFMLHAQGGGVIEGKLVNGTDPGVACADAQLEVVGLATGMNALKSARSDATGRFRIDGLPTDQPLMVRTEYKSVSYHARVAFDSGGKASVAIEVFEPASSADGITVEEIRMAFQLSGDQLRSLELYSLHNSTKPPRTFVNPEGTFRFSKAPGILEPPRAGVTAPGATMPLAQSPLESADGRSYYLLYPLRPGVTTIELDQILPYKDRTYVYRRKFYQDLKPFDVGVVPADATLTGEGRLKLQVSEKENFAVYRSGPIKAGTEVVWTFAGGTPAAQPAMGETSGQEARVVPMPNAVGRNALVLVPLVLIAFIAALWYATSQMPADASKNRDPLYKTLRERRDQLLNHVADLDHRLKLQAIDRSEHMRRREHCKRQLRRIALILAGKQDLAKR
jgi:hypothetical protein